MTNTAPRQDIVQTIEADPPTPAPIASGETAAILNMIERAASNPQVDLDKMERLFRLRKEVVSEAAERAFNVAMKSAQAEMRPVSANANNPQTRSRYATYDQLDRALRPIYTRHGFSLSFDEADSPKPDHIRILCYVAHDDGHSRTYRKDMPADGKGAKGGDVMTKTHAVGAAASYGSRYLLKGIFNVAVGEDDRDGNTAEGLTETQVADLRDLMESTETNLAKFLAIFRVKQLADIPSKRHDEAVRILKGRESERAAR